mmetsp:Transcript_38024/g.90345  ORF Transcript_38024/g.90345 Transcript_38024/m.90345 type:complete len:200 (-) Transcript_38024:9-608(-)
MPASTRCGTSAASHGARPRHIACAMPNRGTFFAQSGLKCTVRHILPPRYIFAVFPSSEGMAISGAVTGYVTGVSNSKSNSYLRRLWMYQHFPLHLVPVLSHVIVNQSWSFSFPILVYCMSAASSSLRRSCHFSWSLGPAFTVSSGIFCTVSRVLSSKACAMTADKDKSFYRIAQKSWSPVPLQATRLVPKLFRSSCNCL